MFSQNMITTATQQWQLLGQTREQQSPVHPKGRIVLMYIIEFTMFRIGLFYYNYGYRYYTDCMA